MCRIHRHGDIIAESAHLFPDIVNICWLLIVCLLTCTNAIDRASVSLTGA